MKNRVITISRDFGSGGRTIGKQVAEKLRIPCYDNELLTKIAEESGFQENYIKEAGEYAPGGFLSNAFSHRGLPADDDVVLFHPNLPLNFVQAAGQCICRTRADTAHGSPPSPRF